jgi:hypothetical protein
MLDGVHVVGAGLLEESLEVVSQRLRLVFDAASNSRDVLHVGVSCDSGPLRTPLSPLLAALDILHVALDDNAGWCHLAAAGDRFPTSWGGEIDCFLAGGVLGIKDE